MCNVLCTVQCTYSVLYSVHCTSVQYKTAFFFSLLGSCVRVIMCKQIRLFTVFITRQTHFPISVPQFFFHGSLQKSQAKIECANFFKHCAVTKPHKIEIKNFALRFLYPSSSKHNFTVPP